MGVVRTGESEADRELAKWDMPKRMGGYGPDGYEHFPLMLSKAQKKRNGQYAVHEQPPLRYFYAPGPTGDAEWNQACLMAEEFTRNCQLTVRNQQEFDRAIAQGWVQGQDEAMSRAESFEREMGQAAAERAYADRNMGELAKRESSAAEDATSDHLPEVPRKRVGWPKGKSRAKKPVASAE